MRDYRKYNVWQNAHELTLTIYKQVLPVLPRSEQYDLTSQIKRAAYSIPINIAEDCGRNTDKDFLHFLDIALGSAHELEYCSLLIYELGFINKDIYENLIRKINEVKAKRIRLIKSIRKV
jgi:four helix bundle protein